MPAKVNLNNNYNSSFSTSKSKTISTFTLAMINVSAVASIKNLPIMVECGMSMIFYYTFACFCFLIPCSLVAAELTTGWPEVGGIYNWVNQAMGPRFGFFAVWFQWSQNIVWFPTQICFVAGIIAYIFNPELVQNKTYMIFMVIFLYWLMNLINLRGIHISSFISIVGATFGICLPGLMLLCFALYWIFFSKNTIAIDFTLKNIMPSVDSFDNISFLAGMILSFAGMEMSAVHIHNVSNPKKNYPKAIFFSSCLIILIYVLGSMSLAVVIPKSDIKLIDGVMQAFVYFLQSLNIEFLIPFMAILIACGSCATLSTWMIGPAKAIFVCSNNGELPVFLRKKNNKNMPIGVMICQGIIITILCVIFIMMPTIEGAFWILLILCSQFYTIMYIMMFVSAIILRIKNPNKIYYYKIPGGNIGLNIIASIGIISCLFSLIVGLFPPSHMEIKEKELFYKVLLCGSLLFIITPFIFQVIKNSKMERKLN